MLIRVVALDNSFFICSDAARSEYFHYSQTVSRGNGKRMNY